MTAPPDDAPPPAATPPTVPAPAAPTVSYGPQATPDDLTNPAARLTPGTALAGRYELCKRVAVGGQGVVYLALDRRFPGKQCAVKVVATGVAARLALHREAQATAAFDPEYVVQAFDRGEERGVAWFAMEWVDGPTLHRKLRTDGPLPWPRALATLRHALRGLEAAHAVDLLHRDFKPANLILTADGSRVKLLDLGLACPFDPDTGRALTGDVAGTLRYMAPESWPGGAGGPARYSPRSDVYAAGATLFELLSGRPPYHDIQPTSTWEDEADPLRQAVRTRALAAELPADTPPAVRRLVAQAAAPDPAARFANAAAFAHAIDQTLAAPPPPPVRRRRWGPAVAAAAAAALAVGGWFALRPAAPLTGQLGVYLSRPGVLEQSLNAPPSQLPLRAGNELTLKAAVGRPAYHYVLFVDRAGRVVPRVPTGWAWPAPPPDGSASPLPLDVRSRLTAGPTGWEAVVWFARRTPLSAADHAALLDLFPAAGLAWSQPGGPPGTHLLHWRDGRTDGSRGAGVAAADGAGPSPAAALGAAMRGLHDRRLADTSDAYLYPFAAD